MAVDFPTSPSDGDTVTVGTKTYSYNASKGVWKDIAGDDLTPSTLSQYMQVANTTALTDQYLQVANSSLLVFYMAPNIRALKSSISDLMKGRLSPFLETVAIELAVMGLSEITFSFMR